MSSKQPCTNINHSVESAALAFFKGADVRNYNLKNNQSVEKAGMAFVKGVDERNKFSEKINNQ